MVGQINAGDIFNSSLSPSEDIVTRVFSPVNVIDFPGLPNILSANSSLHLFAYTIFQRIGIAVEFHQLILYFLFAISGTFGAYFLLRRWGVKKGPSVVASFFWVFNPVTAILFPSDTILPLIAFLPICLNLVTCMMRSDRNVLVLFSASSTALLAPCAANPPLFVVVMLCIVSTVLASVAKHGAYFPYKRIVSFIILSLLMNLFWLKNYYYVLNDINFYTSESVTGKAWEWVLNKSSIMNLMALKGYWALGATPIASELGSSQYFSFSFLYENTYIVVGFFLCFYFPILYCLFFDGRPKTLILLSFGIFLILLFLVKSINPPLSEVNNIINSIPFYYIMREPWTKYMPFLIFAISVCWALSVFRIRFRFPVLSQFSAVLVFFYMAYPWMSASVIPSDRGIFPGVINPIPQEYVDLRRIISEHGAEHDYYLTLPSKPNNFYQAHYRWWPNGYYGVEPVGKLLNIALFPESPGYLQHEFYRSNVKKYLDVIESDDVSDLYRFCQSIGVRFIIIRDDLDVTSFGAIKNAKDYKWYYRNLSYDKRFEKIYSTGDEGRVRNSEDGTIRRLQFSMFEVHQSKNKDGSNDFYMADAFGKKELTIPVKNENSIIRLVAPISNNWHLKMNNSNPAIQVVRMKDLNYNTWEIIDACGKSCGKDHNFKFYYGSTVLELLADISICLATIVLGFLLCTFGFSALSSVVLRFKGHL